MQYIQPGIRQIYFKQTQYFFPPLQMTLKRIG